MTAEQVLADICSRLADDNDGAAAPIERARRIARAALPLGTADEVESAALSAVAHVHGLGPLQPFLADPAVNEVMVNNGGDVWVERDGSIALAGRLSPDVLPRLIERILSPLGRRLDRLSPIVDARLDDGTRVCAVIPPVAVDGPCLSLRRFGVRRRPIDDFAAPAVVQLLDEVVDTHCNVVISGSTSSGKTSLLNVLAAHVRSDERIITLEDTAELQLHAPHVLRLETRAPTAEGSPPISLTDLVRVSLRLRPDRLVIGEIRGAEVIDMLQALNTGHRGCLATVHANSPADALRRIEALVVQHVPAWPIGAVRDHIASTIDVVVHVERDSAGGQRVTRVIELAPPGSSDDHRLLVDSSEVRSPLRRGHR